MGQVWPQHTHANLRIGVPRRSGKISRRVGTKMSQRHQAVRQPRRALSRANRYRSCPRSGQSSACSNPGHRRRHHRGSPGDRRNNPPCLVTVRRYGAHRRCKNNAPRLWTRPENRVTVAVTILFRCGLAARHCPALHRTARSVHPQPAYRELKLKVLSAPTKRRFLAIVSC
jgi:hypothetical protein